MITKGDQEPLAITIKKNDGSIVTPQSILGVKIKINDKTFSTPEVKYNSATKKWELPLTQKDTYAMGDILEMSAQVNFGGTPNLIKTSPTQRFQVGSSLFNELWG